MADTADWRTLAERAMEDLRANTGDSHSDYYTRAAANFIPGLAAALLAACTQLEAVEREREVLNDEANDLMRRAEAAEKERDEALAQADRVWDQTKNMNLRYSERAEAAEARLVETQKALERIAAMDEPDMYAGTAERFRSLALAALTTHPADE